MALSGQDKMPHHGGRESMNQGISMSHRIEYAKSSPEGYKAFCGVYLYLKK